MDLHASFTCTGSLACSAATASFVWLRSPVTLAPTMTSSVVIGGHGVTARVTGIATRGSTVTITGNAVRATGTSDTGALFVPQTTGPALGGVTIHVSSDRVVTWVAHYSTTAGSVQLQWAASVDAATDMEHNNPVAASAAGLLTCLTTAANVVTVATSEPITGLDASSSATLPGLSNSTVMLTPPHSTSQSVLLSLDVDNGSPQWSQWASSDGPVSCNDIATRGNVAVVAGDVSAASSISVSEASLPLDAEESTLWLATVNVATGTAVSIQAMGSAAVSMITHRDSVAGVELHPGRHQAFVVANTAGGELRSFVSGSAGDHLPTVSRLSGPAARPATPAAGSSDIVVFRSLLPTGGKPLRDVLPLELPGGMWSTTQLAGLGQGRVTGVSVGRRRTVTVGSFKGTLTLDANNVLSASSLGDAADPTHGSDPLLVVHDSASITGNAIETLPLIGTGVDASDEFSDTAASSDGLHHFVTGFAAAGASATVVGVGTEATVLPGNGGRDGFVFSLSDRDGSVEWMREVGAVGAADDTLSCIATAGGLVVAGGQITGALPEWGTRSIFSDAVEQRQLAIVYLMAAYDGAEIWAKAFGTDTSDGIVNTESVAFLSLSDGSVDGVVMTGSFSGGNMEVGDVTLSPPPETPGAQTGFVVLLDGATGAVRWARRVTTVGGVPSAASFSTIAAAAASPAAIAVVGSFLHPGTGVVSLEASMASSGEAVNEDVSHGFVAVLDPKTGQTTSLTVPQCPDGCSANSIAIDHGRAAVAFTYFRRFSIGNGDAAWRLDEGWAGSHVAVVFLGGLAGSDVLGVQRLGAGRGHKVSTATVTFGRGLGGALAVAGWRDGSVSLRDASDDGVFFPAATLPQPVLAVFGAMSCLPDASQTSGLVTPVLFGNSAGSSGTPLREAVASVVGALGSATSLTALNFGNAAVRGGNGLELANSVGDNSTATDAVLVASQRRSGSQLWTWRIGGDSSTFDDVIAATSVAPDGSCLCVTGSVSNASKLGGDAPVLPREWGVILEADVTEYGAGDVFIACFDDEPVSEQPLGLPRWVALLATPLLQRGTAVAVADGAVFVGYQSSDAMPYASGLVPTSLRPGIPCVIGSLDIVEGTRLTGVFFGGSDSGEECRVNDIAVSDDATLLCAVGSYTGESLIITEEAVLYPSDPTKEAGFVACFSSPSNAGAGPYTLLWASGSTFDFDTFLPQGHSSATVTGVTLGLGSQHGALADRVYVSGTYFASNIEWGSDDGAGVSTFTLAPAEAEHDPCTAFVAAFDVASPSVMATASWVSSLPSTEWQGIQGAAGVAIGAGGEVLAAVATSSPVQVSPFRSPVAARVASGSSFGAGSYVVVAALEAESGTLLRGHVVGDPSADLEVLSQVAGAQLISAPALKSSLGLDDGVVVVGAARGEVRSTLMATLGANAGAMSSHDAGDFIVFHAGAGFRAQQEDDAVWLTSESATSVTDLRPQPGPVEGDGTYVVQFEVWRSDGSTPVSGGSWRSHSEHGSGVTFEVPAHLQRAQVDAPQRWILIEAPVTAASTGAGAHFGAIGGEHMLDNLRVFSLHTSGSHVDVGATWRVRHIRLVPRCSSCVPCGQVPVRAQPVALIRPEAPENLAGGKVALQVLGGDDLLPRPIDASSLVDTTCNCLRGAVLQWEQTASAPLAASVTLSSTDGMDAGATTLEVSVEAATDAAWDSVSVVFDLEDHTHVWNIDWHSLASLTLEVPIPHAAVNGTVPAEIFEVRNMVLRRTCPKTDVVLHPRPTVVGSSFAVTRNEVKMERGQPYRILSVETNMFGQDGVPICSPPFIADDTPPDVSNATVFDLDATDIARINPRVDVAFTSSKQLTIAWDGSFSDPDSDVAGVLMYRVSKVAVGSISGPLLAGVTSEEKLLPVVSSEDVTTAALPLEDGELYFASLDVCNVRCVVHRVAPYVSCGVV